jgi:hypothetical protein
MATVREPLAGVIDIDSDAAPPIERDRLYRLWEEGGWSAKALDFTQDALDWRTRLSEEQRRAALWNYAMFLDGEESVTTTLAPFLSAVRRPEDRVFLATQIADEARHHVFFDRFLREVCGVGHDLATTLATTLAATRPSLSWGYRQVFDELDRASDAIRRNPRSLPALARGITLYHIVVEGMLAHTGQHFLREYGARDRLFPGFGEGINLVARDESRHIAFGIQLLRELVTGSSACKAAAIGTLNRVLPWATGVFTPPGADWSYIRATGFTPQEVFEFGIRSVETKVRRAGIEPSEVLALVQLGCANPVADQAARAIALVEGAVVGTDEPPRVTEAAMDAIFAGIRDVAAWTRPRHTGLRATIQWRFTGARPRYLRLSGDTPEVGVGELEHPTLTLSCAASDWARIVGGRLDERRAVLTRRVRVFGDWGLARRLSWILPV